MKILGPELQRASECEAVVRSLPTWFGIEQSLRGYADDSARLPGFALEEGKRILGFVSLAEPSPPSRPGPRLWLAGLVAALAAAGVGAAEPPAPQGMLLAQGGALVVDPAAGLAWPRCAEGMRWSGSTCTGEALRLTHAEAVAWAAALAKAEGVRWRVPRVPELRRLMKPGREGLDPAFFPAAPLDWHWTMTTGVNTAAVNQYDYGNIARGVTGANANHLAYLHGWAVNLESGAARGDVTKRTRLFLRVVRPAP